MSKLENHYVKEFVKSVFNDIYMSKSICDLEEILEKKDVENKYWIKDVDYPKLEFSITISEIKKLEDESYISNYIFNHN